MSEPIVFFEKKPAVSVIKNETYSNLVVKPHLSMAARALPDAELGIIFIRFMSDDHSVAFTLAACMHFPFSIVFKPAH